VPHCYEILVVNLLLGCRQFVHSGCRDGRLMLIDSLVRMFVLSGGGRLDVSVPQFSPSAASLQPETVEAQC